MLKASPQLVVITLNSSQRQNLLAFLQRTQLTGKEVPAFQEVFSLIQRASPQQVAPKPLT